MGLKSRNYLTLQALRYRDALRTFLRRFTRDERDVDDLLQSTFTRFLEAPRRSHANIKSMEAYLRTIARNVGIDWTKKRSSQGASAQLDDEALEVEDGRVDPERSAAAMEGVERMQRAYTRVPPQQRRVFEMAKFEHLSTRDIAARLNISESTVSTHLSLAMSALAAARSGE
jgi:RNA polymerase sigma factor (sigma-70 family)